MKRMILLLLFFLCLYSQKLRAQSTPAWPKTLLWRISGNGLSKNSFLYGTMHLQDKRLFYFTDSLYYYLEQADGYALEIDLREYLDSIVQKAIDSKEEELINKKLFNAKDKKKVVDSLIQNVKKYKDKASKKQLERWREEKLKKAIKNKEMPTMMDAYLYGIARRQGKWLGGIEDVQDQLALSDELGAEITSEELLMPDNKLAAALESMIEIYLSSDLEKIEEYAIDQFSEKLEDLMFLNRNIKMAKRMDSLAHIRSMFFTVGAAHLPGDSGVINLLKSKGYKLDPVFSSKKIDPEKYASLLNEVPWVDVEDEYKTYEVKMPGKPSDLGLFDGLIKMKFYADITTLTYFMAGSVAAQQNVDLDKMMKKFAENTDGKILSQKKIEKGNLKGVESVVAANDTYFKVQYLFFEKRLYMLIAGGEKKALVEAPDVLKFFQSFIPKKTQPEKEEKEWSSFEIAEKAFTISFPGKPKQNKANEKKAEGSEWNFTVYDYTENSSGMYYMIQIRDLKPGYYLPGDSVYFSSFRDNFNRAINKVIRDEITTVQSFPAFRFDGDSQDDGIRYRTLNVTRGNRVYTLFTGGAISDANDLLMENFLASFRLTDYKVNDWRKVKPAENDFSTTLPFSIEIKEEEEKKQDGQETKKTDSSTHYISFNPNDVVSYEVFKSKMPAYYWTANDSVFFADMGLKYVASGDSVISKAAVTNGRLKGMEWIIQMPDNNIRKKFRQVLNGDTLYTLISFIPSQYIDNKEPKRFFDEFRATYENTTPTIFKSKASQLLKDLTSTDSATFTKTYEAMSSISFNREDLPFLHQALISDYLDDTVSYYSSRNKIIDILVDISDSSTVNFIQQHYIKLPAEKEALKFDLLEVLAGHKTQHSYAALKRLLLEYTPKRKTYTELSYRITDSLELARNLFPEILALSKDNLFAERIMSVSLNLLDSGLISLEMLRPYETNFVYTADTILAKLKLLKEDYNGYDYVDIVRLVAAFNDEPCNKILRQYQRLSDLTLKQESIILLLKNNQQVLAAEVEKLAADKYYRRDIYDGLLKIKRINHYPAKYLSQRHLAESDMCNYAYDDEEPSEVSYIGEKTITYRSKKQRVHLFKVVYSYENDEGGKREEYKYLGIAGPFSMDSKNMKIEADITGIFYDEQFDPVKTNKQLAAYIKSIEETD